MSGAGQTPGQHGFTVTMDGVRLDAAGMLSGFFESISTGRGAEASAQRLMAEYGTLQNLFEAPQEKLRDSCRFLPEYQRETLLRSRPINSKDGLKSTPSQKLLAELTPANISAHLQSYFENADREKACILCLDERMRAKEFFGIGDGASECVQIDLRLIQRHCERTRTRSFILVHNHLYSDTAFSYADYLTTAMMFFHLAREHLVLSDHLLMDGDKVYSLMENGYMDQLADQLPAVMKEVRTQTNQPFFKPRMIAFLPPVSWDELIPPFFRRPDLVDNLNAKKENSKEMAP